MLPLSLRCLLHYLLRSFMSLLVRVNPFWIELGHSTSLSLLGFLALKASKPRTATSSFSPKHIDLFLPSTSAATVSCVSTIEMEFFSNTQLIFLTILMFVGGKAFTSMLGLLLMRAKIQQISTTDNLTAHIPVLIIELTVVTDHTGDQESKKSDADGEEDLKLRRIKILGYLVLCYVLVVHIASFAVVSIYLIHVPSAGEVLKRKGPDVKLSSTFSAVSTFANCGFMRTNENMMVFKKNSGLLLILIHQVLMGNTLYPVCLRSSIWFMEKMTERAEFRYMLKNSRGF